MQRAVNYQTRARARRRDELVTQPHRPNQCDALGHALQQLFGAFVDGDVVDGRDVQLAADASRRLDDRDPVARCRQVVRRRKPGDAAADDDDVHQRRATSSASAAITVWSALTDAVRANGSPTSAATAAASMSRS